MNNPVLLSLEDNQGNIAERLKILLYKKAPQLTEALDIENDQIFLEPLLFAAFNNHEKKTAHESVLNGYLENHAGYTVDLETNSRGVAYLPNVGYFDSGISNSKIKLSFNKQNQLEFNHSNIKFRELSFLPGSQIEHLTENIPLLDPYFKVYVPDGEDIETTYVEIAETSKTHSVHLSTAYRLLADYCPDFFNDYNKTNKKIVTFTNPKVISFVTFSVHGTIFLSCHHENNEIFFLEELIHQGAHNYLNSVMDNKGAFFKIDPETALLGSYLNDPTEYRTIFSTFHGLYTVAKRVELFEVFYSQNVFQGRNKHELTGRYCDQFRRFRTGLQKLDLDHIYTPLGKEFYMEIDRKCAEILETRRSLAKSYNIYTQPQEFSYNKFCIDNPFEEFMRKEETLV